MPNHFRSIGFPVDSQEEMEALLMRARKNGRRMRTPHGHYVCWTVGDSIDLWVHEHREDALGLTLHFTGSGRMKLGVSAIMPGEDDPMGGSLRGWADPSPTNPEDGAYPLVVTVPDFALVHRNLRVHSVITVQIAAIAHELACYEDDTAFDVTQGEPKFASESFIPMGMFEESGRPTAMAMFAGHVQQSTRWNNPVTGQPFHHLVVKTLGGTVDVVADPAIVEGQPVTGGVVQGVFWLSGRVIPETISTTNIFGRLFRRG